ncbi:MAG: neutral zinc metallopeptidase [Bacteroidaceae bacterium]|nr:neutral zinc metallopeptidase [Bacteroidaceae bacterium]
MKLDGRRESTNVDDRRGKRGLAIGGGMGIVGVIIAAIMTFMQGGDITQVVQNIDLSGMTEQTTQDFSPEEQELAKFSKQILAGTEDVWTEEFKKMGKTYVAPKLVLYTGAVKTACGNGSSSMGPFYCSGDQCVYIDLSFFMQMKKQLGADGDFAYAYVIAHEVGHHVQYLLGVLDDAHEKMARLSEKESNQISVRLELQADFYAGLWAYHDNKMFGSLEDGDIEEGIRCAEVIGDNYLQEKARGHSVPDSFTHGTSAQRMRWLKKGLTRGDIRDGDSFSPSYSSL